jgi:UDP-2-acetamido-3-amino-2,3-dideoxy-glucuronate N-acetyltransferase
VGRFTFADSELKVTKERRMPHFCKMNSKTWFAHPSAVIDDGAIIGSGTHIWHFSHLMPSCRVGQNCILGQNTYVDNNVVIGNGVKVQNNVSIYNGVTIEDDVFLGPSVVFTNVTNPRSFIERKNEFKKTLVRKGATIGANATIVCGIEIGPFAMVGAVVTKNISAHSLVVGNPARHVGWVSEAGHTLEFDMLGFATDPQTGQGYRLIENTLHKM